jgi:hypothetical protein
MSVLKTACVTAGLLALATPCLAFSPSLAPPLDNSGRSMLSDPDAALESTTSAMKDAYVQNNFEGGLQYGPGAARASLATTGGGPAQTYTRALNLVGPLPLAPAIAPKPAESRGR